MNHLGFAIGILSWRGYDSLENSLHSYKKNGLSIENYNKIVKQISDTEKYEILSDKNRIREWKTPPQRGLITDFYNKVLAHAYH